MNVKIAISMMAKNPAVNFNWENDLVALVNSFLPNESQLDPRTAGAKEVETAIGSLEASLQDMVYAASLDASPNYVPSQQTPPPAAPAPVQAPAPQPEPAPAVVPACPVPAHDDDAKGRPFRVFAYTLVACVAVLAFRVGDGVTLESFVQLINAVAEVVKKPDQ